MKVRGDYVSESEQFFVFADRSPLHPANVRNTLHQLLQNLNLQAELYNTHSLHAGRACDLRRHGFTVEQIQRMGRWRSNVVYKYLRQ